MGATSMRFFRDDFQIDGSFHERSQPVVETTTSSPVIGRATTLVMAIGCGVVVATVYSNQPMLGIMEAAFPGQVWITDLVPMATQLGFALGLLLLVPLGDRVDRRSLILLQLTAFACSLAAAALSRSPKNASSVRGEASLSDFHGGRRGP
jgi:MFS family permease